MSDFFSDDVVIEPTPLRLAIAKAYRGNEPQAVHWMLGELASFDHQPIAALAKQLMSAVRKQRVHSSGVDALMHEFSLSSEEGVALMCLAECLLRIPDHQTVDRLISDKISKGDWRKHLGESSSLFVNAATWGLLITGKLVSTRSEHGLTTAITQLIAKGGEPLIRKGVDVAMRLLGRQFVAGLTIEEAIERSVGNEARGYRYSYDMLGEAALTAHDAATYFAAYEHAMHSIGKISAGRGVKEGPGISVKLSALHPRYGRLQRPRVMAELLPRLKRLVLLAKHYNIGFNIDAEEADRLELSLDLIESLVFDADSAGFEGLGIVVQAYQKRCPFVIDFLIDLARRSQTKLMVRLVKGAYWDTEIKRAQVDGLDGYPVYTRKAYTDVSYLLCAQKLLAATDVIYPQFATHNALTLSTIYHWAQDQNIADYEFQCLHGMGESLYDQVVGKDKLNRPCRIYAPVGSHETLLPYLVRRLLENGANSSFVNQIVDETIPIDKLVADPIAMAKQFGGAPYTKIPLPAEMFGEVRKNSMGFDVSNEEQLRQAAHELAHFAAFQWSAMPLINGVSHSRTSVDICNPAMLRDKVGSVIEANRDDVDEALKAAFIFAKEWSATSVELRAAILNKASVLLEARRYEFIALAVREAGKSLLNAVAEVREAVDFLRYYAQQIMMSPTGCALGPVVCISPWNFPLAIFVGQVSAALAAGNVVLAKPAEQTPLIAYKAVELLYEAGIPRGALQFLPGKGEEVGAQLVLDHRVKGVIFTGSTEVAHSIHQTLATRALAERCDIALIAETGGQNAMIVDSSALPEQVVQDVLTSAFDSAGQRCSALRVLCVQDDIFERIMTMLKDAAKELRIGNPSRFSVDIGPVIDIEAKNKLNNYINKQQSNALSCLQLSLSKECEQGHFVAPTIIEIPSISVLENEVFGPVLHVLRFKRDELPQLLRDIHATGFGLTLGIHSRIDETIDYIVQHTHVGNIYVNRNMVGAVVGVQPFGGEGKSGTGPKAGGPLYLRRLQTYGDANINEPVPGQVLTNKADTTRLDALLHWLYEHEHETLFLLAKNYAIASPKAVAVSLNGPTGERNTYGFGAKGKVFCAAASVHGLLNQLAAVLATDNTAVLSKESMELLPKSLPNAIKECIETASQNVETQIALIETPLLPIYTPIFANNNQRIIALIETNEYSTIPLWRLLNERVVSVNTTAAGGNASLMTLGG